MRHNCQYAMQVKRGIDRLLCKDKSKLLGGN